MSRTWNSLRALAAGGAVALSSLAYAQPQTQVPIIDTSQGPQPAGVFTTDGSGGFYRVRSRADTFEAVLGQQRQIVGPNDFLEINIEVLDNNAENVIGVPGPDYILTGSIDLDGDGTIDVSGTLLTAEVDEIVSFVGAPGFAGFIDLRFTPTGGQLFDLGFYDGRSLDVFQTLEFGGTQSFTGSFGVNFNVGDVKAVTSTQSAYGNGTADIGDKVFFDQNGNGLQDQGEPGIGGVRVLLTDDNGNVVSIAFTDSNGLYTFRDVTDGNYTIQADPATLPPNFSPTQANVGGNDNIDSDSVGGAPFSVTVNVVDDFSFDMGYVATGNGSIGDTLFRDLDRDGIQDAGEPGIQGVTVTLTDAFGVVTTTTTGVNGQYLFFGLPSGTYSVDVIESTLPPGLTPTDPLQGGNPAIDSNFPLNGDPVSVTLPDNNTNDLTIDGGYVAPATGSIGDFIFVDQNGNGIQDPNEPGIDGVTVKLLQDGVVIAMTTSGPNGAYEFTGLPAGDYVVMVVDGAGTPLANLTPSPAEQGGDTGTDSNGVNGMAPVTLVGDNDSDPTIDFGYVPPAEGRLGDFVFFDEDRDGIQDPDESGIANVTVLLLDENDMVIATDTTDLNGAYLFTGLEAGDYQVQIDSSTLPTGFTPTVTDVNGNANDTLDSDGPQNGDPVAVNLPANDSEDLTIDFGFVAPGEGRLGDFVFLDTDNDGIQDAGEPGLEGVTVELRDSTGMVVQSQETDVDGGYLFEGLLAGTYTVDVDDSTLQANLSPTLTNAGGNDALDSDGPQDRGAVTVTLATDTSEDLTIDFGYVTPEQGRLGDFVFNDFDEDGIQDAGEEGIPGVRVELRDPVNNDLIAFTLTEPDGSYDFNGLAAGDYRIVVIPPANSVMSPSNQGVDDAIDSDENGVIASLPTNQTVDLTYDFGFYFPELGRIGDFVWFDENADGIQNNGEVGIPGVTVELRDANGTLLATDVTGAMGDYIFEMLSAGTYRVDVLEATLPAGFVLSPTNAGGNDEVDSDGPQDGGFVEVTLPLNNSEDLTIDFGYNRPAGGALGDTVFFDTNGNGVQDNGEPGIENVRVILRDLDDGNAVIADVRTDENGNYLFDNLPAGRYRIVIGINTLPDGVVQTADPDGVFDNRALSVTLGVNETNLDQDFGYNLPAGRLGDFVFLDNNANGIQDAGDNGIPNVTVNLLQNGQVIDTQQTGPQGEYLFEGLTAGTYQVDVVEATLPAGVNETTQNAGGDDTVDSDVNANGDPVTVVLADDNSEDLTIDFGYVGTGSIGDTIWNDLDGDGVLDGNEDGIPNVTVKLQDAAGNTIATTQTDANGNYSFDNLPAGDYVVMVDLTTLPAGLDPTFELDGNLDGMTPVTLAAGETNNDVDFGYQPNGAIGDRVFEDLNGNGQQDAGEPGILGVTVNLLDAAGNVIATDTTDADGNYLFEGVAAGVYGVDFIDPAGFTPTVPNTGNDATDSDNPLNSAPVTVTLADAQVNLTVDAGYIRPAALGDKVFVDTDGDGIQDANEPGIAGVTVQLFDSAGNLLDTQTTDNNGMYLFGNLAPGTYRVRFIEPNGFNFTIANAGTNDAVDSDADITTGQSPLVTLSSGETNLTVDAGVVDEGNPNVCNNPVDIDFSGLARGTIVDDEYAALGITVSTNNPNNPAMIFDSSNPTGGDFDLGTPNQDFGGPGIGSGGSAGQPGQNDTALGNVLIISEDGDQNDPDDNGAGGTLIFTFDTPKDVLSIDLLDIDASENSVIRSFRANGTLISTIPMDGFGNNSVKTVIVNALDVSRLEIQISGSGAVTGLHLCMDNVQGNGASVGDRVWLDSDGDGFQDAGEPGIAGVVVQLLDDNGTLLQTRVTDANGNYLFDQLPAGNYRVVIDQNTLDPTFIQTFELDGVRNGKVDVTLAANEAKRDVDFGYLPFVDCAECDGGVSSLTFTNNGPAANIVAVNDGETLFSGSVPNGGTFTVNGQESDGKFGNNDLILTINGSELAERPHLSCSQPIGVGTEFGPLVVSEGASRDGGAFCPVPFNCNECDGGVTDLTFVNNGPGGNVQVINKDDTLFSGFVATGGTFMVSGQASDGKFEDNNLELLFNGNLAAEPHVSCSQPISVGTEFGQFEVTDGASRDGGAFCPAALACSECDGGVTSLSIEYLGAANANVVLRDGNGVLFNGSVANGDAITVDGSKSDGKFDGDLEVVVNGTLQGSLHLSCSDPIGVGTVVANGTFVVVEGSSDNGGAFCPFPLNCMECDGGVTSLTFSYDGPAAFVQAKNDGVVLFSDNLQNGDTFTVMGTKDDGQFEKNELELKVNGTLVGEPHLSCSQPIDNGSVFGPFTVIDGASAKGGQFCPIPGTPPVNPSGDEFCPDEAISDQFGNGSRHAMIWFGVGSFVIEDAKWNELGDGSATFTGTLIDANNPNRRFAVDALATGATTTAPAGSPKKELNSAAYSENGGPVDTSTWTYYTGFSGKLTGMGDYANAAVDFTRRGPALQVGAGASGKNVLFGASTWIDFFLTAQSTGSASLPSTGNGDFNLDFEDCDMDQNCMVGTGDNIGTAPGSSSYSNGIWTVSSGGGNWGSSDNIHFVHKTVTGDTEIIARLTSAEHLAQYGRTGLMIRESLATGSKNIAATYYTGYNAMQLLKRVSTNGDTASVGWTDNIFTPVWMKLTRVGDVFTHSFSTDGVNYTVVATKTLSMNATVEVGLYAAGHGGSNVSDYSYDNFTVDGQLVKDDCGPVQPATGSIGDTVWLDQNANGILDAGEVGIANVNVLLLNASGVQIASTTTDANGVYSFDDLPAGDYTVVVMNIPTGLMQTFELDGSFDGETAVSLAAGQNITDVDFGYMSNTGQCDVCDGGVTELTLKYTGSFASIKIDDGGVIIFNDTVQSGGLISLVGQGKNGRFISNNLEMFVDGVNVTDIHVSCSVDISIGSQFGPFTVVDGASRNGGQFCPAPGSDSKGEVGKLTVTQNDAYQWHTVQLERTYTDPVIIMSMATANSSEPITLRTRNAGSTSFEFQVDEWNYQNGYHPSETVNYMVVEAGEYTLPNGKKMVAGSTVTANADEVWVNFGTTFDSKPIVLAQVGHDNSTDAAVTRVRSVSTTGFQVKQQEEEALSGSRPAGTVYYVAIEKGVSGGSMKFEAGSTGDNQDHNWRTTNFGQSYSDPIVFAGMQTKDGGDTANTRQRWLMSNSVEFKIEEEQSANDEISHTSEEVGYFITQPGLLD